MENSNIKSDNKKAFTTIIEILIRIILLGAIIGWCFLILSPFFTLLIWAVIISIAIFPIYDRFTKKLGGRRKLSSFLLACLLLIILLIPTFLLGESLFTGIQHLRALYNEDQLTIPPPGDYVNSWPVFTKPVVDLWRLASENLSDVILQYNPQLKAVGKWLISAIAGTGTGILIFIGSIILTVILLYYSSKGGETMKRIFVKLMGDEGENYIQITVLTIRSVFKGVLGVALIQSLLAGIGIMVAGIPLAGLWILLCLILAMIQLGVGPIMIPLAIYMFASSNLAAAIIFLVWTILVTISDNILKPFLLGKGAPVPLLVVFLGSIGGFIVSGFIGLFLGPVIMSLGYTLFNKWLGDKMDSPSENPVSK